MQSEQFQLHAQIEQRHWWFVARRQILRELVRTIAPNSKAATAELADRKVVVDIGCGTGANLAALAEEYQCVGIDTSAEAISLARRRFPDIFFVCGFAPQDVAGFLRKAAVVMLTDVLEHVADDRKLLASIVAACPAGAQILITVPADMRLWSPHDVAFGHYRRYDDHSLAAVWAGLPVKPRLVSYFNRRLYPLVRAVRAVNHWRGRSSGEANTDFALPAAPINSMLEKYFAGEARRLLRSIDRPSAGYRRGVSLIAILERENVPLPAAKPVNLLALGGSPIELAASTIPTPIAL
ncbi:MAG TPA: class I SAM-dependent methyltransferase [Pirellulales bacterium]|jgi:SAM-dependent methyltransferase|nr:class I SAM-dependent methyltransferase [Pirellulales bacterium]